MRPRSVRRVIIGVCAASLSVAAAACNWDPSKPFEREAPPVKEAIVLLDAGEAGSAATKLEEYLATGACSEGNIGAPDALKRKPDGTFDLALSLFKIGESFGKRFGDEENDAGGDEEVKALRKAQVECALRVVRAIAGDDTVPLELRARAHYLEGNLNFLNGDYEDAVKAYDQALVLAPGMVDAGDPIGRDAAWNRAIALRRIEDKKDAGQDASPDAQPDAQPDAHPDAKPDANDAGKDSADDSGKDSGQDSGGDAAQDSGGSPDSGGNDASQPPPQQDASAPPPRANQDERILDQLENAPTLEQEKLKRQGQRRRVRGMADK